MAAVCARRPHLVQQHYLRRLEDGSGDGHPLLLPPAQLQPPLAHLGVVAYQRGEQLICTVYGCAGAFQCSCVWITGRQAGGTMVTA